MVLHFLFLPAIASYSRFGTMAESYEAFVATEGEEKEKKCRDFIGELQCKKIQFA